MTTLITISCPEGIVMGADTRITTVNNSSPPDYKDGILKIRKLENYDLIIGYWGNFPKDKDLIGVLIDFEKSLHQSDEDIDKIAEKLKIYLEENFNYYDSRMGFQIANFIKSKPEIRHVFHEPWCPKGIFINENSNESFHNNGIIYTFNPRRDYRAIFNGENSVANAFFNYIPLTFSDRFIFEQKLSLEECKKLIEIIIQTTHEILNFYFNKVDKSRVINVTGKETVIVKITNKGFKDIKNYEIIKKENEK